MIFLEIKFIMIIIITSVESLQNEFRINEYGCSIVLSESRNLRKIRIL